MNRFLKYCLILFLLLIFPVSACIKTSQQGELIFEDSFDSPSGSAKALFGDKYMSFECSNGSGKLTSRMAKSGLPAMYAAPAVADFIAVFDFRTESVVPDSGYGIIFRSDNLEGGLAWYYRLLIKPSNNTADFDCWKNSWVKNSHFELSPGLVKTDVSNHVKIEARGSNFNVYVNDKFAFEATDTTLTNAGIMGLCIASGMEKPETVYFDNLRIYKQAK